MRWKKQGIAAPAARVRPAAGDEEPAAARRGLLHWRHLAVDARAALVGIPVTFLATALATHILNPLIVNHFGEFGPFRRDFAYIVNRRLAYHKALGMIATAAEKHDNGIIAVRTTAENPEQPALYKAIVGNIRSSETQYTQAITYDSDPDLRIARGFLQQLGDKKNVRLTILLATGALPGCVITEEGVIVGFNDEDDHLFHALFVAEPQMLVGDFRSAYLRIITKDRYSVPLKRFGQYIRRDQIEAVLRKGKKDVRARLAALRPRRGS
jgi:hypothetical protein